MTTSDIFSTGDGACVLAKRSYDIHPGREAQVAEAQIPLRNAALYAAFATGDPAVPRLDSDLFCVAKPGTDVVVHGSACSSAGPVKRMEVAVGIATERGGFELADTSRRRLLVTGDRRAFRKPDGSVAFSSPEPFQKMRLGYERAFGGRDVGAERAAPDPAVRALSRMVGLGADGEASIYDYPRNPIGRGYLVDVTDRALADLPLPNVEHVDDLLTPERVGVGHARRWHVAPRPGGFGWVALNWFPRLAFAGVPRRFDGPANELAEVRSGYLPEILAVSDARRFLPGLVPGPQPDPAWRQHIARIYHGASPWLALPTFTGRESIVLWGMHAETPVWPIPLPRERPEVRVAFPDGRVVEAEPKLRTIEIDADALRLELVWAATAPLGRILNRTDDLRHAVRWAA